MERMHFARFEDLMLFPYPLLGLARDNENELFSCRMIVEWMGAKCLHIGANQQEMLVLDHVGAAKPFLNGPGGLVTDGVGGSDETAERRVYCLLSSGFIADE